MNVMVRDRNDKLIKVGDHVAVIAEDGVLHESIIDEIQRSGTPLIFIKDYVTVAAPPEEDLGPQHQSLFWPDEVYKLPEDSTKRKQVFLLLKLENGK